MIRLAFLGVFLIGGLIAFGAFYVARGSESDPTDSAQPTQQEAAVQEEAPQAAEIIPVEKLYFLQGVSMDQGDIAVVLFDATSPSTIVRDQGAIVAAQDIVFVNETAQTGQPAGQFLPPETDAAPEDIVAQIYRDDVLIGTVICPAAVCETADVTLADLPASGATIQRIEDRFDNHADYLSTIEAIAADPNYMLLHARPRADFPAVRDVPSMQIQLPTVVAPTGAAFDATAHEILVSTVLSSLLPTGASIRSIAITDLGGGLVGDGDRRSPVLAGGAPITYPDVRYHAVTATVDGAATLDQRALDTLSSQTLDQYDYTADFATFARERLQNECADCFVVLVEGGVHDEAWIRDSRFESYDLDYFDLRDTP